MAVLHHGCSGHCCAILLVLAVLAVLVGSTVATPRFDPASSSSSSSNDGPGKGLARSNAVPWNDSRTRPPLTSPAHRVPEALKHFNFNARKADLTRTPGNAEDSDDDMGSQNADNAKINAAGLDWTSHVEDSHSHFQNELADIALVVTVDGSIHAIKRETGTWVWSLHDENKHEQKQEVLQNPLVRSSMRNSTSKSSSSSNDIENSSGENIGDTPRSDSEDEDDDEVYIIEPHSAGDIYVYHKSTAKLQRLPLSLTQLVELSPFTFPVRGNTADNDSIDTDNKLFVGRKESKLVGVDLKTGKLVGVFGPEAGWCEWPQTPTRAGEGANAAASPGRSAVPGEDAIENRPRDLLYLGQTDYHLSIYSKTQGLLQTLSYTSYGPSSLAQHTTSPIGPLASSAEEVEYQTSFDGRYIQPMHDGSLICLNPDREGIQWTNRFSQPVVGIFDIWYPAPKDGEQITNPSQAQPVLSIHPHHRIHNQLEELANIPSSTFVGKLSHPPSSDNQGGEEYYAMSNYHFPLVSFAPSSHAISGASSPSDDGHQAEGSNKSRHMTSIVGSHRVEEPIDSGRTIGAPPTPLSIDPPEVPAQLPDSDATARPALPPAYEAGYKESVVRYLTLGGLEPNVSFVETLFLLGGLLIFSFAFMRRKMITGRPALKRAPSQVKETTPARGSDIPAIERTTSTTSSSTLSSEQKSLSLPTSEDGTGTVPRRMPSHTSNPSLDKALPALPVDDVVGPNANEGQSEDEENDEQNENGLGEKARNPKKGRRRRRGGKRNNKNGGTSMEEKGQSSPETSLKEELKDDKSPPMVVVDSAPVIVAKDQSSSGRVGSLEVSESVLGYGSHGTVVLKGTFQGRAVAVKRLLKDFVTVASHEVSLLQESDDHPNVIRYFCKESYENFHYIALELCPTSLFELIDTPQAFPSIIANFDATKALKQMTRGLAHLHKLKIIHRDLKPQNILVATSPGKKASDGPVVRLVISDFGLCKKLDLDESSFLQSTRGGGNHAPGSFGYRAPEVLRGEVDADDLVNKDESSASGSGAENSAQESSLGSRSTSTSSTATLALGGKGGRKLTRAIDIFSLGCIFYFVLTMGEHPFGSRYEREINILNDKIGLEGLSVMTEGRHEAQELIRHMCASDPRIRPTANDILVDPLFWPASHSLHFLCDASDRFEILEKDHFVLEALEAEAPGIVGNDWLKNLDRNLIDNLGKYRKYDGGSVRDLLRVMRNKKHHYQDLPDNVRRSLGEPPAGFLSYFTKRFPRLLLHVHTVVKQYLAAERMFNAYFEYEDS